MAVIINDFEVVTEQAVSNPRGAVSETPPPQSPSPAPRPEDIERIMRHFIERRQRIAAD